MTFARPPLTRRTFLVHAGRGTMKLGKLTFEALLVGHGEPILEGASAQVAALAAAS